MRKLSEEWATYSGRLLALRFFRNLLKIAYFVGKIQEVHDKAVVERANSHQPFFL